MKQLILHPTDICQWHALINEAQAATHIVLNEHMESYLVFLLIRFSQGPKLIESVIAFDFLESLQKPLRQQIELLKEVGDKSLLFCGLFPGLATKRRVSLDYFVDIGQTAYRTLSEFHEERSAELYLQLSAQFLHLQQILQATRGEFLQSSLIEKEINPNLLMQ